jgi:hypothetical protein
VGNAEPTIVLPLFCRTGREIPSFFILAINVVRASPGLLAAPLAPPITQPTDSNVCKIELEHVRSPAR